MRYSFLLGMAFLAASVLLKLGIAPYLEQLPADYSHEFRFDAESRFRESPNGDWQANQILVRRMDQTLTASDDLSIIQSDMRWISHEGSIIFVSSGIYGVNRDSYKNQEGYGNTPRTGQFLFPPHLQPATFDYWDTNFIGKRVATFNHEETVNGLKVFVFDFQGSRLDETAGYSYLPDVPESYFAFTDGSGKLWIEPVSGTIVAYEENGESYFVNRTTNEKVANFFEWHAQFTPEIKTAQFALAQASKSRIEWLDSWLPAGLLLAGLACFGFWAISWWHTHHKSAGSEA